MSAITRIRLAAGLLAVITLPRPCPAEAPSLFWHWAKGIKTAACKKEAPVALQAELKDVPLKKGDNTWWAKSRSATATVQCIKTGRDKSMAVMIVTSDSNTEARALRDGLKRRITPPARPNRADPFDPDKVQY